MDDIRRPQHLKRRDYAIPAGRPPVRAHPQSPHQPSRPHHSIPHHHPQANPYPQPITTPVHHQAPATPPPRVDQPHQPIQPATTRVHSKRLKLSGKAMSIIAAVIVAGAAIFGAGYLLKGSNDSKGIPASITRQVNYDLYFPSPMPGGYIYMKDTATFQIGQVFYKFANGKKRVTVNEQPMSDPKPNLSKLPGYTQFQSPVGPAAIGSDLGEPTAVVLTPTTVITMHCVGGVNSGDLKTAVNNLKDIGQKPGQ